jgi:hypothetical protein
VSRPERPGEAEPVALLVDLVAPVRNHAHNRMGTALLKGQTPTLQEFNELADADVGPKTRQLVTRLAPRLTLVPKRGNS